MQIQSVNPYNGKLIQSYSADTPERVAEKIRQTYKSWSTWKEVSFSERGRYLYKTASILRTQAPILARLMAAEMGKPFKAGLAEIEKCAVCCEYYAENSESFLKDEIIDTEASKSYIRFQPLGVILAVMPWNFPFWQLFRFLAPALMAGNCGVLKHASNVFGCALAIENIIRESGFPEYVFQTLLVSSNAVEGIIENPLIKAVTLTGSTTAGKKVAEKAASVLKKSVLELGGSDAYIILADADLEHAAEVCVDSRLINSGQSCIAAKRFIVLKHVEEEFTALFKKKMESKVLGDPLDEKTDVGPQARFDLRDELHQQVIKSIELGATCILGGEIPQGNHALYPPTILSNVKKGMPAYDEEIFGPVAAIITAQDEDEAVNIANDSIFGLGAAVFSRDIAKAEQIAATRLEAGSCFVNESVKSDPRLPFGGIKESGYGRELGVYGIKEFVNIKTVWVG
ncbi:NAD-dependent succinate-semialdehyde dehydrogenase [Paradesertivirga mongoliensis]|uniref:NAD-dependent succinate-semialdehyde dehydrogenase n=1 Tax=Paradesertivirga mongoliensis TaxID=2100740 RepID=A0ABW4ZQU2_9SPHI|nr:NAD-dependent succinate-semialdehyde dehydrogenase [Pedobacter mongoliensis]